MQTSSQAVVLNHEGSREGLDGPDIMSSGDGAGHGQNTAVVSVD